MTDYRTRLEAHVKARVSAARMDARHRKSDLERECAGATISGIKLNDIRSLLSEAERLSDQLDKAKAENARLRALVDEAGKVVEPLVTFLSDADDLQNRPDRGDWGVECALCMGELVEDSEKRTLEAARSLLTKLKGEGQ